MSWLVPETGYIGPCHIKGIEPFSIAERSERVENSLPVSHTCLPTHARSSCECVHTDHPADVEHPEIVPTAMAKEAERGHHGAQFVNNLLVCSLLVSLYAKEGPFRPNLLRPSAPAGRSLSVSILAKHGAVHGGKFDQLHSIASSPGHPNC